VASAKLRFENGPVRYTVDGTAPTTTVGTLVNIGDVQRYVAAELTSADPS